MREMKFTLDVNSWKELTIRIVDEKLFTEKYGEYILENGGQIDFYDLVGPQFENCVQIIEGEDGIYDENVDEYYDEIDEFLGIQLKNN